MQLSCSFTSWLATYPGHSVMCLVKNPVRRNSGRAEVGMGVSGTKGGRGKGTVSD